MISTLISRGLDFVLTFIDNLTLLVLSPLILFPPLLLSLRASLLSSLLSTFLYVLSPLLPFLALQSDLGVWPTILCSSSTRMARGYPQRKILGVLAFLACIVNVFLLFCWQSTDSGGGSEITLVLPTHSATGRILVATRIHQMGSTPITSSDIDRLLALVRGSLAFGGVAVAVGAPTLAECMALSKRVQGTLEEAGLLEDNTRVTVVEVFPWGRFTPALNALLALSIEGGYDLILFQSVEMAVNAGVMAALRACLGAEGKVVVCGAVLPDHAYKVCVSMCACVCVCASLRACALIINTLHTEWS
jgi:hypothetical protein